MPKEIKIPKEKWEVSKENVKMILTDIDNFEGKTFQVINQGESQRGNPWVLIEIEGVKFPVVVPINNLVQWQEKASETEVPLFEEKENDMALNHDNVSHWLLSNNGGRATLSLKE